MCTFATHKPVDGTSTSRGMDESMRAIKAMIDDGETDTAIEALESALSQCATACDVPYYLLGNAYRKRGHWRRAMNNYLEAVRINPDSPAAGAHAMLADILNFRNKDMYNQ